MYVFIYSISSNHLDFSMNNSNQSKTLMRTCNGEVRRLSIASYPLIIRAILDENTEPVSHMNLPLIMASISALSYKDFCKIQKKITRLSVLCNF